MTSDKKSEIIGSTTIHSKRILSFFILAATFFIVHPTTAASISFNCNVTIKNEQKLIVVPTTLFIADTAVGPLIDTWQSSQSDAIPIGALGLPDSKRPIESYIKNNKIVSNYYYSGHPVLTPLFFKLPTPFSREYSAIRPLPMLVSTEQKANGNLFISKQSVQPDLYVSHSYLHIARQFCSAAADGKPKWDKGFCRTITVSDFYDSKRLATSRQNFGYVIPAEGLDRESLHAWIECGRDLPADCKSLCRPD